MTHILFTINSRTKRNILIMEEKLPEFEIKRSKRKTISLEITREAKILVRAPQRASVEYINSFVAKHRVWILSHIEKRQKKNEKENVDEQKIKELTELAKELLPERVAHFAAVMGVHPTGVKITGAKTRLGSCSGKNSLCFSWRVMLYPPKAIDYVVVHELSHIIHHDHSKAFWKTVEKYMPDYKDAQAMFKF